MRRLGSLTMLLSLSALAAAPSYAAEQRGRIPGVQPMTGIVLWEDSGRCDTDAVQLEYSYMKYGDVVARKGEYDWAAVEKKLDAIARRKHQAVLRFYDTYVGQPTTVPDYIKRLPDYKETNAPSEGKATGFPDWSHPELQRFHQEFYARLAEKYDCDPRLAFLETGFGLWAEYHIYDGPMQMGKTFPSKEYQERFLRHLASVFRRTPWMISVDAADGERTPFETRKDLLTLPFGLFDDSFLCKKHAKENEPNWNFFGRERYLRGPAGGEFSYYNDRDQKNALAPNGPNGISFEAAARAFHISFMIGSDQPQYQTMDRIREAGMACGYRFRIVEIHPDGSSTRVVVTNAGVAPIYYDAFVAAGGARAKESLRGLPPGGRLECVVPAGVGAGALTIACDRLVPGQRIGLESDVR